jgi:hypothetical protein
MLEPTAFAPALSFFTRHGLISDQEAELVFGMFDPNFAFASALTIAQSIHVQVKVDNVDALPQDEIEELMDPGAAAERSAPGFRKYGFAGGMAVIFTSGPIAEEDLIPGAVTRRLPFVDHFGIDLREDSERSRDVYTQIPLVAMQAGWRTVRQGAPESPVRGCYCEVLEKMWVFPPDGPGGTGRPIEFAFGELKVFNEDVGCDYRPIDPAHPLARLVPTIPARAQQVVGVPSCPQEQ